MKRRSLCFKSPGFELQHICPGSDNTGCYGFVMDAFLGESSPSQTGSHELVSRRGTALCWEFSSFHKRNGTAGRHSLSF